MTGALASCAAPDLGPLPQPRAAAELQSEQSFAGPRSDAAWPRDDWWTAFGDAQLDALVREALAASPDVAAAQARIRVARGAMLVAGAQGLPQISGSGSAGVAKQSYNNGAPPQFVPHGWITTGTLALSGDFDLDLWGKNRKALAAATSDQVAATADARQAEVLLAGNVASTYFDLSRLIGRGDVLAREVAARTELTRLVKARVDRGLDNDTPLLQSQALEAQARNTLAGNAEQVLLTRHALAALLGAGPDRGLTITPSPIAAITAQEVPADAGIALVGRRPDIVAARMRVEASGARIDVARANFLPDISLRGLIGFNALHIADLFKGGSTYGNAGPAISLPIFQGGRLKGEFTQARGRYDEAVANYDATVIDALREVADAYASRNAAVARQRDAEVAADRYEAASALALRRYKSGLATYIEALTAQTGALDARAAAVDARFRTLAYEVALKRALGGGYVEDSMQKAPIHE